MKLINSCAVILNNNSAVSWTKIFKSFSVIRLKLDKMRLFKKSFRIGIFCPLSFKLVMKYRKQFSSNLIGDCRRLFVVVLTLIGKFLGHELDRFMENSSNQNLCHTSEN